jgi:hypothetical protein
MFKQQYDTFIQRGWPPRIASIYSGWNSPITKKCVIYESKVVLTSEFNQPWSVECATKPDRVANCAVDMSFVRGV